MRTSHLEGQILDCFHPRKTIILKEARGIDSRPQKIKSMD